MRAVVDPDGRLRLPEEFVREAKLRPGQEVEVSFEDDVLTIYTECDEFEPASEAFLEGLREALDDARGGRGRRFDSTEEFLAGLDGR